MWAQHNLFYICQNYRGFSLCTAQFSCIQTRGHWVATFALRCIHRTLAVASKSSAHTTGQCWNVSDSPLNRSAGILLFLLTVSWHSSSGACVLHIVCCGHAHKWGSCCFCPANAQWVRICVSFWHEKHPSIRLGLETKHCSPELRRIRQSPTARPAAHHSYLCPLHPKGSWAPPWAANLLCSGPPSSEKHRGNKYIRSWELSFEVGFALQHLRPKLFTI